jgi:opacity protein-like surface antigen
VIHSFLIHGQKGYYITDGIMSTGVEMIDNGPVTNARICQVKEKKQLKTYTPDEVAEYGFQDGATYVARVISLNGAEKKVFLERLSQGTLTLYYYKSREVSCFYLEEDSGQLVEVPRKDSLDKERGYREILSPYVGDCEFVSDQLEYVSYHRMSFHRFANRYNECLRRPFPHMMYGLTAGYGFSRITTPVSVIYNSVNEMNVDLVIRHIDFKYDGSLSFGFFIDIPVQVSDFSFHAEANYNRNHYRYDKRTEKSDVGILVKTSSLNVPVMLRYAYPFVNCRPFVNAGAIYSFHMNSETQGFHAVISENSSETSQLEKDLVPLRHQAGLTAGCGIQINLSQAHSLCVEFRYMKTFSLHAQEFLRTNSFGLSTSINF